jgi:hypothetical protein
MEPSLPQYKNIDRIHRTTDYENEDDKALPDGQG